ncbi:MAG: hypothetical protein ACUVRM_02380 [Bacillota bacterium]
MALNSTAQAAWVGSTVAGNILAGALPDPGALGLDFALSAMFIGLLLGRLTGKREVAVAVVAVLVTLGGAYFLPANWNIILGALVAAGVGLMWP